MLVSGTVKEFTIQRQFGSANPDYAVIEKLNVGEDRYFQADKGKHHKKWYQALKNKCKRQEKLRNVKLTVEIGQGKVGGEIVELIHVKRTA